MNLNIEPQKDTTELIEQEKNESSKDRTEGKLGNSEIISISGNLVERMNENAKKYFIMDLSSLDNLNIKELENIEEYLTAEKMKFNASFDDEREIILAINKKLRAVSEIINNITFSELEKESEIVDLYASDKDNSKSLEQKRPLYDDIKLNFHNREASFDSQEILMKEKLSDEITCENLSKIEKIIESRNFTIYTLDDKFKELYRFIDFIAVKSCLIKDDLKIIYVELIKFLDLHGPLIIEDNKLKYNSINEDLSSIQRKSLLEPFVLNIKKAAQIISKDLKNSGILTRQLINLFNPDIYQEKFNFSREGFFYRDQQVQYKIKIHTIIATDNNVGFVERDIPYAYQSSSNLYFVNINDISDLLGYIETKNSAVEIVCIKKQPIVRFLENKESFTNRLRIVGILSGVFVFLYLLSLLFFEELLFSIIIFLQYPFILISIFLLFLFFFLHARDRKKIVRNFNRPFGIKHPDFKEDLLELAINRITPAERGQFLYEIYGKTQIPFQLRQKVDKKSFITDNRELFESDIVNIPTSRKNFQDLKERFRIFEQKGNYYKAYCILRAILVMKLRDIISANSEVSSSWLGKIHDIFKLFDMLKHKKIYNLDRDSGKKLKELENIRKEKGVINKSLFQLLKVIIFEIMKDIQDRKIQYGPNTDGNEYTDNFNPEFKKEEYQNFLSDD